MTERRIIFPAGSNIDDIFAVIEKLTDDSSERTLDKMVENQKMMREIVELLVNRVKGTEQMLYKLVDVVHKHGERLGKHSDAIDILWRALPEKDEVN